MKTQILRLEKENIFAMTYGVKNKFQIIIGQNRPLDFETYYILYPKKTNIYKLSTEGVEFKKSIGKIQFEPKFIAKLDSIIDFSNNENVFNDFFKNDILSIWEPSEPQKYFLNKERGKFMILRVYKIIEHIPISQINDKSENNRNPISNIYLPFDLNISHPVIPDKEFDELKKKIISLIKQNDKSLKVINNKKKDVIKLPINVSVDEVEIEETLINELFKTKSLSEIENELKSLSSRDAIQVNTSTYKRDPRILFFAKKRAEGKCDLCNNYSPIQKNNNDYYLETHHVLPMKEGGRDEIKNISALCPNCHKILHFDKNKDKMKELLINNLKKKYKK
ncbi:MAG: hypothetical protein A2491_11080 [Bacteroidetes bacterium RIFOXYC12_FULL_35_7]|nr:MAG: hypothetical protein A2491_11080 [Bacteroidetes bacterium RIFOXYC12_FULL_35_7]